VQRSASQFLQTTTPSACDVNSHSVAEADNTITKSRRCSRVARRATPPGCGGWLISFRNHGYRQRHCRSTRVRRHQTTYKWTTALWCLLLTNTTNRSSYIRKCSNQGRQLNYCQSDPSRATFSRSPVGEKFVKFFFLKWRIRCTLYFWATTVPPKRRGARSNLPPTYHAFSTGLLSVIEKNVENWGSTAFMWRSALRHKTAGVRSLLKVL